uniref:B-cell scaffold protein with ankyrin repeats n=1 Tax=Falco tinnunculus TaxID=100819 RepID=A0A8C4UU38_FALTI
MDSKCIWNYFLIFFFSLGNTKDILVIYEQEAEEWALYLKSLFGHIVNEGGILLYNLEASSFKHRELFSLPCYKCKLLILSCGLLNCLNRKRSYFLEQVLKPPDNVVILLCGVENSEILYEILTLDGGSKEISTDQEPEEYLSVVTGIIQPGNLKLKTLYDVRRVSEKTELCFKTEMLSETLETNEQSILVLPGRISCENPGEIFILLKDEIDDETLEIEFIAGNKRIRTQPTSWNKKVKYVKALDFCAGPVHINVYCGGVIKTTAQIEYYTALEEIEHIFKKVADPIAFTCQVKKLDNVLTWLLKSKISTYKFSPFQSEEEHHQQTSSYLEEFPTLLHCAARFGLKNLATFLLSCPEASWASKITNKHGEDPANIAEKHGHRELRKLITELSVSPHAFSFLISFLYPIYGTQFLAFSERNFVEDRSERECGGGLITARYREDQDTCEGDGEEEDPYTLVKLDESPYDFVLAEEEEEKRKERRSFIMNRPPAPAPRPMCSPVRDENTPYIVQVFQQKATRVPGDNNRTYCRKPAHRGHTDTVIDSTVKHNIPAEQEELIHLQEQVKKGAISVDEALDRFKQWQNEKQILQSTQQGKNKSHDLYTHQLPRNLLCMVLNLLDNHFHGGLIYLRGFLNLFRLTSGAVAFG